MPARALINVLDVLRRSPSSGTGWTGPSQLPPPDASGRTNITTSDNPSTLLAANTSGRFLVKAGTHLSREFNFTGTQDVLCEPNVILDGQSSTSLCAVYGAGNGWTFRGWDNDNRVEIRNYKQVADDSTGGVQMGPKNVGSFLLSTGITAGYLWLHDNGVVNVRPGNQSYLGYSLSETAYGLAVGGGGVSTSSNRTIIEHNTFRYSNTSNADPGNQGGQSKFVGDWMVIRHNTFAGYRTHEIASTSAGHTHNDYGLWLVVECTNYEIHDNIIEDIYRAGLIVEISARGSIYNNTIRRIGFRQAQAFLATWGSTFGAGIQIAASGTGPSTAPSIDIYNNDLTNCYEGICGYQGFRGRWARSGFTTYEKFLQNMAVHDNTLTSCGPSGILNDAAVPWATGQSYTAGANTERSDASHRLHNGRNYRCILSHTSSTGVNEPSGTSSDNTWWKYQGINPILVTSGCTFDDNTYINCGFPTGETAARAATTAPFYRTGATPANFAAWQAAGPYDTGGSFTGTANYSSS